MASDAFRLSFANGWVGTTKNTKTSKGAKNCPGLKIYPRNGWEIKKFTERSPASGSKHRSPLQNFLIWKVSIGSNFRKMLALNVERWAVHEKNKSEKTWFYWNIFFQKNRHILGANHQIVARIGYLDSDGLSTWEIDPGQFSWFPQYVKPWHVSNSGHRSLKMNRTSFKSPSNWDG